MDRMECSYTSGNRKLKTRLEETIFLMSTITNARYKKE